MTRRICMWSGPRNISTTMMRSFGNRPDTTSIDEPFYAHFLAETGLDHPMRDAVLASQPTDWRAVVAALEAPCDTPVLFAKQMTHHVTPAMDLGWLEGMDHFFLIRDPVLMAASFADRMGGRVTPADLGVAEEAELYDIVSELKGAPPPVVDAADILGNPHGLLSALCAALDLPFDEAMLSWQAGRKPEDGVWGAHWYKAVESSTGFREPVQKEIELTAAEAAAAATCLPWYTRLHERRLTA